MTSARRSRSGRLRRRALAAVGLLVLGGCAEGTERGEARSWNELPFIPLDTVLVLGGAAAEGAAAFGAVTDAEVMSGPVRLAVADRTARQIRVFDLEGRHLVSFGGAGSGPGEFNGLPGAIVALDGGRLGAWDTGLRRFTVFGPDGTVESVVRPDLAGLPGTPSFVGAFPGGGFVLRLEPIVRASMRAEGVLTDTTRFVSFQTDGARGPLDVSVERPPRWWYVRDILAGYMPLIFGRSLRGFVSGERFLTGSTDARALDSYDAAGNPMEPVDLLAEPRPMSPEEVAAERERRVAETRGPSVILVGEVIDMGAVLAEIVRELPAYDTSPIFDEIQAGGDGIVWMRAAHPSDAPTRQWVMISAGGSVRGQVTLPAGAEMVGGGAGHAVVATEDELGATVLVVVKLRLQ